MRMRATIPPISEPPRPSPSVAYHGIGSGPGRASRARPPTTKPQMTRPRMKRSTPRLSALGELLAHKQDPLHDGQPRGGRQQVDRPLQRTPRREHQTGRDDDHTLGARAEPDVAAQPQPFGLRARVTHEERS